MVVCSYYVCYRMKGECLGNCNQTHEELCYCSIFYFKSLGQHMVAVFKKNGFASHFHVTNFKHETHNAMRMRGTALLLENDFVSATFMNNTIEYYNSTTPILLKASGFGRFVVG